MLKLVLSSIVFIIFTIALLVEVYRDIEDERVVFGTYAAEFICAVFVVISAVSCCG